MKKLLSIFLLLASLSQAVAQLGAAKQSKDGRIFYKANAKTDTTFLMIGGEYVRLVPAAKPVKVWPPLSVKIAFSEEKGIFNAQGIPAEEPTTWRYRVDGGAWQRTIWEQRIPPGPHTVDVEFSRPGYPTKIITEPFTMPGVIPSPVVPPVKPTPKPKPDENQQTGTGNPETIVLGGIEHRNGEARVNKGEYDLVYRAMPGSARFHYTPRAVLQQLTTDRDLHTEKLPPFDLTDRDLVMYFSGVPKPLPTGDYFERLLSHGYSHVDSRAIFNSGFGPTDTNRPGKGIPWKRRAHMTMPNNFDWLPAFQAGHDLTNEQLNRLRPWVLGDGVSNYFTDGQVSEWHLFDWEFKYNDKTWTSLVTDYHAAYPNSRYVQSWMGHSQIPDHRDGLYDAWNTIGYYHLNEKIRIKDANFSDGQAPNLENWKLLFEADFHNHLQGFAKNERYAAQYPNSMMLGGYMGSYEDGLGCGCGAENWTWGKLHPSLAENAGIWTLLTARADYRKKGGYVIWNSPYPTEPLSSEQYGMLGNFRLSFLNDVRNQPYQWLAPQVSFDNKTWKNVAGIEGARGFSTMDMHQEREGVTVKEPHVRCLVTDSYVVVFAQNPHPDAPAVQTFKIRIPGVIEDFVTIYNQPKTQGNLTYQDRELTIAIAAR